MELNGSQTENFDTIEKAVQDGTIDSLSLNELKNVKKVLLTNSPLSDNPRFIQRWERVNAAVTSKIDSRITRRRFKVQVTIGVLTLALVLLNLYLSHTAASGSRIEVRTGNTSLKPTGLRYASASGLVLR